MFKRTPPAPPRRPQPAEQPYSDYEPRPQCLAFTAPTPQPALAIEPKPLPTIPPPEPQPQPS